MTAERDTRAGDAEARSAVLAHDGAMEIIKWAWRHGSLSSDTFDSLDNALEAAHWASEYGEESVEGIEVIADDGTVTFHDSDAVFALMEPLRRRDDAAYDAQPKPTVILDLRSPNGTWGVYGSYVEREKADADAARFRRSIGDDRVRLRPYGTRA
jgi:hypothetical protein